MKIILIIDDDEVIRSGIARGLRADEFTALTADSAEVATEILDKVSVDAIVLDRMMTGMDGVSFLKKLRANNDLTPVLMLTALSGTENTIDGLTAGANDYLGKPFSLKELGLRLNNLISTHPKKEEPAIGLVEKGGEFWANGMLLSLSESEKQLLSMLLRPIGRTVSTAPMIAKRLKSKIVATGLPLDIITVRGQGYKLVTMK
jgi:DNA-binding response OmpR family regulator